MLLLALAIASTPVPLIIDTDLGFDVDDVGAIAVANHLQDRGECRLLAVLHDTGFKKGVGGVAVIRSYYNRSFALGAYKGEWASSDFAQAAQDKYTTMLLDKYPSAVKNYDEVPTALHAYRTVLADAEDASVVIASIGEPTNLRDLLSADRDLVRRKVKRIVFMDGAYNFGCAEAHGTPTSPWLGSTAGCEKAAEYVEEHLPRTTIRQVFTLNGGNILTAGRFNAGCGQGPVKAAYQRWTHYGTRPSWDPIAVVLAVRGSTSLWSSELEGTDEVNAAGDEVFNTSLTGTNESQAWIDAARRGDVVRVLDDMLCAAPCRGKDPKEVGACAGYSLHSGANCYGDRDGHGRHGADDLENPPSASCGVMTLEACMRRCDATHGCDAVTVAPADDQLLGLINCYRKANVRVRGCDAGAWRFETWVKRA